MRAKPDTPVANGGNILTAAELKLLDAVRQEHLSKVTVQLRQGKILNIETEADIPQEELDDRNRSVIVRNVNDYETLTLSRHQGKTAKAKRIRPMPLTEQENRRVLPEEYNGDK